MHPLRQIMVQLLQVTVYTAAFTLKFGIWELLRLEKIPETHVLATLLTGSAWPLNAWRRTGLMANLR